MTIIAKNITEDGTIHITNHTTDKEIVLSGLTIEDGKKIVVDCKKLTATVEGENVINYFNDFSDFSLIPGENNLECIDSNGRKETLIEIEFYKPYVGI